VAFVVWQRKKERASPPPVFDVQEAEIVREPPRLLSSSASLPALEAQGPEAAKQSANQSQQP
jgi:hypothetical protein